MWEVLAIIFVTVLFLLYLLKLYLQRNSDFWEKRGIKTLYNDLTFMQVITGKKFFMDLDADYYNALGNEKFGGVFEFGSPVFFVKDVEIAKSIFVKDFDHFTDRRDFGSDPFLSQSLLFLNGQAWKDMRVFLSPTFTSGKIRRMFQNFENNGLKLKNYITSQSPRSENGGYKVHVQEVTQRFTVDVIGAIAFGMETDALTNVDSTFYKMANKAGKITVMRLVRFAIQTTLPKVAKFFKLKLLDSDVCNFFFGILARALKARESLTEKRDDFLQLLVEAKEGNMKIDESELNEVEKEAQLKPNDSRKSKLELTDSMAMAQAFSFFGAGFDTVSNFLNLALYALAAYPEMQEKVFQEVEDVVQSSGGKITYDGTNRMEYLDMFVSEVMRMFPLGQRIERKCTKDYQIPGTNAIIPKGTMAIIPVISIHRDEKYYSDPGTFDPDRFTAENKAKRNAYAYMPFGLGPRNCIAMRFALIESKVALAHLVHNFVIQPSEKTPIPMQVLSKLGSSKVADNLELMLVSR